MRVDVDLVLDGAVDASATFVEDVYDRPPTTHVKDKGGAHVHGAVKHHGDVSGVRGQRGARSPLRVDGSHCLLDAVARREAELLARAPVVHQADVAQVVELLFREVGGA